LAGWVLRSVRTRKSVGNMVRRPRSRTRLQPVRWPTKGLSVRIGLTGIDQGMSSLGNFVVGVAVARVAGVAALGEYSLAFATWLIVAGLHRSLVTDPMAIENDVNHADAAHHIRVGLAAELLLGLASAGVFGLVGLILLGLGQHSFGIAFVTFAPFLPALVVQDYWRWIAFMKAKPAKALTNDTLFDIVQTLAFIVLIFVVHRSSVIAIGAWGVGALAGALFGLRQFSVRPTLNGGLERLRHRWSLSKWLVANSVAGMGALQAGTVLSAAILGPIGVGGFRAANSLPAGPTAVLVQAGGSIGLPEAARALKERGWPGLRRVQRVINLAGILSVGPITIAVLLFSKQLLVLVYGHPFEKYWSSADILAVMYLVSTFRLGAVLCLKTAKLLRMLYHTGLVQLVASIGATAVLAPLFGVVGAAEGSLVSTVIVTAMQLILHWRHTRPAVERMSTEIELPNDNGNGKGDEALKGVDAAASRAGGHLDRDIPDWELTGGRPGEA
jgi:O-antigen/teichoic acid export membrane protein